MRKEIKVGEYLIQGDVIIERVEKLPECVVEITSDQKILQASEVTGHHHRFKPKAPVSIFQSLLEPSSNKTITPDFGKYIEVKEDSLLYHGTEFDLEPNLYGRGDHHALNIPVGLYRINIALEYDYDTNEAVRVLD